jgi:cyanophycinase
MQTRGYLALIGGGEDKQDDRTVLRCIADLNSARHAVVIPTASAYGVELGEEYAAVFLEIGVSSAQVLDVRYADQANDPVYLNQVAKSDLIFFTGGDQVRLVQVLNHTPLIARIRERFAAGATVAGTSAGAAGASDPMIYDGVG